MRAKPCTVGLVTFMSVLLVNIIAVVSLEEDPVPVLLAADELLAHASGRSALLGGKTTAPEVDREQEVRDQVDAVLWPMYVMYCGFLDVVQLKYFSDINDTLEFQNFDDVGASFSSNWQDWTLYLVGFVVCICVGVLTFLVVLISGMVVPCCRCCGKCGGKQISKDGKHADRDRLGCSITLAILNCALILGVVWMYFANDKLRAQLKGNATIFDNIASGVNSIEPYLESTVEDMNKSVSIRFKTTSDEVFNELYDMPDTFMEKLNNETGIITAYDILNNFSTHMSELETELETVTTNSIQLQEDTTNLNTSIITVQARILGKLESCFDLECYRVKNDTDDLKLNVDYSVVNVTVATVAVEGANNNGLNASVAQIGNALNDISEAINTSTTNAIRQAEVEVDDDFVQSLDKGVEDITVQLSKISEAMHDYKMAVEDYVVYVFWSIFAFATFICVIIFTNVMGLFHAGCPRPMAKEPCTRCSRAQGSRWLLASTSLTFFGYWLFVIVVMVTFAAGGLLYTEVCRNVVYYEDTESSDVLNVFDKLINNSLDIEIDLMLFDTYSTCAKDESLYNAFKLAENGYNVSEIVDISAIEDAIENIKKQEVNIPEVQLNSPNLQDILEQLDEAAMLNYGEMRDELNKAVTTINMTILADDLELVDQTGYNLTTEIETLRKLSVDAAKSTELADATVIALDKVTAIMPDNFADIGTTLNKTEYFINEEGDQMASTFVNNTADNVEKQVVTLANDIINDVEQEIGKCRPLYDSLTIMIDAVCVQALYPLNSFWFSLGWCIFFLIPHLIMSFKLSNLFRITQCHEKPRKSHRSSKNTMNDVEVRASQGIPLVADYRHGENMGSVNSAYTPYDPMEAYRRELAEKATNSNQMAIPRPNVSNRSRLSTASTASSDCPSLPPRYDSLHYRKAPPSDPSYGHKTPPGDPYKTPSGPPNSSWSIPHLTVQSNSGKPGAYGNGQQPVVNYGDLWNMDPNMAMY